MKNCYAHILKNNYRFRRGYPSAKIRVHTRSFCSCVINTHSATSATVRPHPRQTSSKVVEQTATHGVSGRSFISDIVQFNRVEKIKFKYCAVGQLISYDDLEHLHCVFYLRSGRAVQFLAAQVIDKAPIRPENLAHHDAMPPTQILNY